MAIDLLEFLEGGGVVPDPLEGEAQVVVHPDALLAGLAETVGITERVLDLVDRGLVVALFQIAETEHVAALDELGLALVGHVELGDGVVEETHFPVGYAQVVMGVLVLLLLVVLDALLELLEDLVEALLVGRGRRLLGRSGAQFVPELRGKIEEIAGITGRLQAPRAAEQSALGAGGSS